MSGLVEALENARAAVSHLEQEKVHALRRFEEMAEDLKTKRLRVSWLEGRVRALEARVKELEGKK